MRTPKNTSYYTVTLKDANSQWVKAYSSFGFNNAVAVFQHYDKEIRGKNGWSVELIKKEHCDEEF